MNTSAFEKYESEVRSYCRKFPVVFKTSKGSIVTDENGKEYIDFFCGAGALNYGHNNDYIKSKVIDYMSGDGITHALDMYTDAKRDFIEFYQNNVLIPRGLDYKIMFPGPTGTNAVEAALKLARKVKGRSNVFALMGAFHGMTLGALALTTDVGSREGAGVPLCNVTHIPAPYMFPGLDTIEYMQTIINDDHSGIDKPAALVIETTQAEGGVQVFSNEFLKAAEEFCHANDLLLIVDDIQVGCGRTGYFFSFERAGIKPDIFTQSKSIGGYGMPFALTLFKPELDIWSPGEHNGTFRGFQPSIVAAKAGLEVMLNEGTEERARKIGARFEELVPEIIAIDSRLAMRGIGCIWGIDFSAIDSTLAKKASAACFERGLIAELAGRRDCVLKLMPSLLATDDEVTRAFEIIKEAVAAVLK
jgi:diaminobutyrate-2-oxoglutarate transaminase